ncbi:MAG: hypothetical protein JWM74_5372, partial [Myxococcaceae bacterium]|nr:hypothetical protein [Myxococcaceae bacterium]
MSQQQQLEQHRAPLGFFGGAKIFFQGFGF